MKKMFLYLCLSIIIGCYSSSPDVIPETVTVTITDVQSLCGSCVEKECWSEVIACNSYKNCEKVEQCMYDENYICSNCDLNVNEDLMWNKLISCACSSCKQDCVNNCNNICD